MKRRRDVEAFSMSFLDCICCGFGAIILLLVLSKIYEPVIIEKTQDDLESLIAKLEQEIFDIRGETLVLDRELESTREQNSDVNTRLARLLGELSKIKGQYDLSKNNSAENTDDEGDLRAARQRLTAEMRRLQAAYKPIDNDLVGGIPVDSEYIIFVIDTSGSMQQYNWPLVRQKITETLNIYPEVKGIQVMNDNGKFMFERYAGKWIPDTPGRRKAIQRTLANWRPFSDSNPVDGILYAIDEYWAPDKKISIFVFGDEFSGRSIEAVVRAVAARNTPDEGGQQLVRIHAVGFPYLFGGRGQIPDTAHRFASLMRVLCARNGGTFVALTERSR